MRRASFIKVTALSGVAIAALQHGAAFAQEADERTGIARGTEIIVTARKQAESLISVPVAVTAMTAEDVNRYAANDLIRISQLTPQVELYRGGSGAGASFVIRGIGSAQGDAGLEQTVTVNIDGLQISRGVVVNQAMFDIQQVEILKGPQALFFGKNSPAGVFSVTSVNPTDVLEGYVKAGYEFRARERFAEGAVGGPLTDTLKIRFAGRASKMDGWIKNYAQPVPDPANPSVMLPGAWSKRNPGGRTYVGRLTAIFEPASDLRFNLKVLYGDTKLNGDSNWEAVCAPGVKPTSSGFVDTQDDCTLNFKRAVTAFAPTYVRGTGFEDGMPFSRNKNLVTSLNSDLRFGSIDLASVTGYYKIKKFGRDDSTGSAISQSGGGTDEITEAFSQELRAVSDFDGPINFTVGAYYEHMTRSQFTDLRIQYVPADVATGSFMTSSKQADNRTTTYSVFGQLRWNILDNLELAGGARWTREKKRTVQNQPYVHGLLSAAFLSPSVILRNRYSDEDVSPEVTLTWHPTPRTTVYGAYKTGYKSGGIANPNVLTVADNEATVGFGAEEARGGEVGFKGQFMDNRVRLELVGYRYTFKGLQTSSYDPVFTRYILRNAASARTTGVEGSVDARITAEFSLRGSFGYNRAKFLSFPGAPCYTGQGPATGCVTGQQDLSGKQLYRAPKFGATVGASYDLEVQNNLSIGVNADARYTSSYIAQENYNPLSKQDAYWLLNAGARVYSTDTKWELALIGRNLTNTKYFGLSIDRPRGTAGQLIVVGNRARELMLQGTFRF